MKHQYLSKSGLFSLTLGLALAGATQLGSAQSLPAPRTFDTGDWGNWGTIWWTWGDQSCTWDALDADGNPNSGSQRYTVNFSNSDGGIWGTLHGGPWDTTTIVDNSAGAAASMSCDIRVDPSSSLNTDNNYGWFQFELVDPGWNTTLLQGIAMTDFSTNWTHLVFPITPGSPRQIVGFMIWVYGGNYSGGHLAFNVDNVALLPPAPEITLVNPVRLQTGEFQFSVANLVSGTIYSVMSSTDLVHWVDEYDFIPDGTNYDYSDSTAGSQPRKFYRIQLWHEGM